MLVTSKVVSKAEGRVRAGDREAAIRDETVRVVARRGPTSIVENHLGLVMAAAGVDASNVAAGHVVLLPEDPDASARAIRERVYDETGRNVAVLVTDTAGRAWRTGQTDLADRRGRARAAGRLRRAAPTPTATSWRSPPRPSPTSSPRWPSWSPASSAADPCPSCAASRSGCCPPASTAPVPAYSCGRVTQDMFALGAREAVLAAVRGDQADCFGSPASAEEVRAALESCGLAGTIDGISVRVELPASARDQVAAVERVRLVAHAHGWRPQSDTAADQTITVTPVRQTSVRQ